MAAATFILSFYHFQSAFCWVVKQHFLLSPSTSNMVRLKLSLLPQCFMCLLILWPGIVHSFPSSNLAVNNRYQRDTTGTEFPQNGTFDLVLKNRDLQFEICCKKDANDPSKCYQGELRFCFPTTRQKQLGNGLFECGAKTCSYRIKYYSNNGYELGASSFTTSDECFIGKIDDEHIYASYTNGEPAGEKTNDGCPLDLQPGNRLKVDVKEIPKGVTVKVLNAQNYVEPTTLPPATTPPPTGPPTTETTNTTQGAPTAATASLTKETEETSDTLLYILIGVGILVFILIAGGIAFAVYWFCFKKKKSPKPAPPDTEPKIADAADTTTPVKKESPVVKDKAKESKAENETKNVERSKLASSNLKTDASKLKSENPFDDETGHGGKSMSKKSQV